MAAKNGGYAISVTVVDGASRQLEAINRRLAAMQAPVNRLQGSVAKLYRLTGMRQTVNGFRDLGFAAGNAARSVSSIIPGLGAITGAATIAGMARLVSSWSSYGTNLLHASQSTGVAVDALSRLRGAARLAGLSAQDADSAMGSLGETMQDALAGRNPAAMRMFNTLGIDIRKSAFEAKKGDEVLGDLAERLSKMNGSPILQGKIARELGVEALLPLLRKGRSAVEEYQRRAAEFQRVNAAGVAEADKMREAQEGVTLAFEGLGYTIAEKVGPHLTPLLHDFGQWIAANREWIATGIGQHVADFAAWVRRIKEDGSIGQLATDAKEWAKSIDGLVQSIGGWKNAGIALMAVWGANKLAPVIRIGAGITRMAVGLTAAVTGLSTAAAAFSLAGFVAAMEGLRRVMNGENEEEKRAAETGTPVAPTPLNPTRQFSSPVDRALTWAARRAFGGGSTPAGQVPMATGDLAKRQDDIVAAAVRAGFSQSAAIAIAANATAESAAGAKPVGDNGSSGGIIHWNGPRREAFKAANRVYPEVAPLDLQLAWLKREADGQESRNAGFTGEGDAATGARRMSREFVRPLTQRPVEEQIAEAEKRAAIARSIEQRRAAAARNGANVNAVTTPPPQRVSVNGGASLNIAFANAPAGMQVQSQTSGIFDRPANIGWGMPGYAVG